MIYPNNLALF